MRCQCYPVLRPVQQLLDLLRRDPVGQHFVDLVLVDAVVGGDGLEVVDVALVGGGLPALGLNGPAGPMGVAKEEVRVVELGTTHVAFYVDLEDLAAVQFDLGGFAQFEIELLQVKSHKSKNTSQEHMLKFYKTFDEISSKKYDGLIVTGAPVENLEFEQVDYWDELTKIIDWADKNVTSTLYICWGAQAGLYHKYNIKKEELKEKLSGVYKHKVLKKNEDVIKNST